MYYEKGIFNDDLSSSGLEYETSNPSSYDENKRIKYTSVAILIFSIILIAGITYFITSDALRKKKSNEQQ